MPLDNRLDLIGEKIHPAGDDHFLDPRSQVQKTILVHITNQTIVVPELALDPDIILLHLLFAEADVVQRKGHRGAHEHLPFLAGWGPGAGLLVIDPAFRRPQLANAVVALWVLLVVLAGENADQAALRSAVVFMEDIIRRSLAAEQRVNLALDLGRTRRRRANDYPHAGKVVLGLQSLGQCQDALEHGRGDEGPVDALVLNKFKHELGIELAHGHRGAAEKERQHRDLYPGMIQRPRNQRADVVADRIPDFADLVEMKGRYLHQPQPGHLLLGGAPPRLGRIRCQPVTVDVDVFRRPCGTAAVGLWGHAQLAAWEYGPAVPDQ